MRDERSKRNGMNGARTVETYHTTQKNEQNVVDASFIGIKELRNFKQLRRSGSSQAGDEARSAESLQNKIAKKIKAPKVRQKMPLSCLFF